MARTKGKLPELDGQGFLADMRDLKLSYRETYWRLRSALRAAEAVKEDADGNPTEHPDVGTLRGAISDVNFAIQWMHTGKRPGSKRGIERRAAYQREKLMDPVRMQSLVVRANAGGPSNLTDHQRFQLEEALRRLSDRERECYELAHGQGFSQAYIARMLGIEKSSVKEYVERAQRKVSEDIGNNLFLTGYWE